MAFAAISRRETTNRIVTSAVVLSFCGPLAHIAASTPAMAAGRESVREAICRLIHTSARDHSVPVDFFTRLIWSESSFRPAAVSPAGAQGIAQFMPATAGERKLKDPFDPEEAIPAAAKFLRELKTKFGNFGLAAAAYNGGPARVARWLGGAGQLYPETRAYVLRVTGRPAEVWASREAAPEAAPENQPRRSCLDVVASLAGGDRGPASSIFAPWGVQLAGNFSRERALASFERARAAVARIVPDEAPMIVGTRLRHRGARPFYRVRIPRQTRAGADALCRRIRAAGGHCVVLPS